MARSRVDIQEALSKTPSQKRLTKRNNQVEALKGPIKKLSPRSNQEKNHPKKGLTKRPSLSSNQDNPRNSIHSKATKVTRSNRNKSKQIQD